MDNPFAIPFDLVAVQNIQQLLNVTIHSNKKKISSHNVREKERRKKNPTTELFNNIIEAVKVIICK
jgi:hypothetical protein